MKSEVNVVVVACSSESALGDLIESLSTLGMRVSQATDGLKAFELVRQGTVDLVVLAEPLAVLSGHAVCKALREAKVIVPILLLDKVDQAVAGLEAGADVVLPLESESGLILAQLHALLRRCELDRSPLHVADLVLDTTTRRAERGGKLIALSTTEYILLELLLRRLGQVVTREEIMEHVWPGESRNSDNVLDVYISYLRTKVDRDYPTALIRTVRGQGYMIAAG